MLEDVTDSPQLEEIPFDPAFAPDDPAYSERTVVVNGQPEKIYHIENLLHKFGILRRLQNPESKLAKKYKIYDEAYRKVFEDHHFERIIDLFKQRYTGRYKKLLELDERQSQILEGGEKLSEEETDLKDYYSFMAYGALAKIAREIDPEYDLSFLWK